MKKIDLFVCFFCSHFHHTLISSSNSVCAENLFYTINHSVVWVNIVWNRFGFDNLNLHLAFEKINLLMEIIFVKTHGRQTNDKKTSITITNNKQQTYWTFSQKTKLPSNRTSNKQVKISQWFFSIIR